MDIVSSTLLDQTKSTLPPLRFKGKSVLFPSRELQNMQNHHLSRISKLGPTPEVNIAPLGPAAMEPKHCTGSVSQAS